MNDNKTKSNPLHIVIIILLIIALIVMYYFGFGNNSKINKLKEEKVSLQNQLNDLKDSNFPNQITTDTGMPITDLVTFFHEVDYDFFAYIDNGSLYYLDAEAESELNIGLGRYFKFLYKFTNVISPSEHPNMKKYKGLNNITKIKSFNEGSGVNPIWFLITKQNKVYYFYLPEYYTNAYYLNAPKHNAPEHKDINIKIYEPLKNYQVKDIVEYNDGFEESNYIKVILNDGTTKKVDLHHVKNK